MNETLTPKEYEERMQELARQSAKSERLTRWSQAIVLAASGLNALFEHWGMAFWTLAFLVTMEILFWPHKTAEIHFHEAKPGQKNW